MRLILETTPAETGILAATAVLVSAVLVGGSTWVKKTWLNARLEADRKGAPLCK